MFYVFKNKYYNAFKLDNFVISAIQKLYKKKHRVRFYSDYSENAKIENTHSLYSYNNNFL